jgi:hypothetical protein
MDTIFREYFGGQNDESEFNGERNRFPETNQREPPLLQLRYVGRSTSTFFLIAGSDLAPGSENAASGTETPRGLLQGGVHPDNPDAFASKKGRKRASM